MRPFLPQVTLCAATSVNVEATVCALQASLEQCNFAACLLFTDAPVSTLNPNIRIVPIQRLNSIQAYSHFILHQLPDHIETSHCLVAQWDGHVIDGNLWDPAFLDYDYIGASWPQYADGHDVGNGGFSLRSLRLMRACQTDRFLSGEAEDLQICRTHRIWLERQGLSFAPRRLANQFSAERAGDVRQTFGYHGIWHMPEVLGVERFWDVYRTLDGRSLPWHDFVCLLRQVANGKGGMGRALRFLLDGLSLVYSKHCSLVQLRRFLSPRSLH